MSSARAWQIAWIALGLAVVALYVVGLDAALTSYDEPVYAEFIRSTHEGEAGLSYRGIYTWQRPPTSIWLYAAVSAIVPGELGMRLLPALLTCFSALFAGRFVARHFGSDAAGMATALFCAAIPSQLLYGRLILSDPPFVALTVLAAAAAIASARQPRWFLWSLLALGSTFAVKSMAGAVPTLALGPWLALIAWRHRQNPALRFWRSVTAFAIAAGAFYAIGFLVGGREFYDEHIRFILLDRAEGELAGIGIGGPLAYLAHLWRADGAAVAIALLAGTLATGALAVRRSDLGLAAASGTAVLMLLLLSLLGTRLAHYLLPLYPVACIAAGAALAALLDRAAQTGPVARKWLPVATVLAGVLALAQGLARAPFDAGAMPMPAARDLGLAARKTESPAIYAYEWYAPQLTYYADRDWHFVTHFAEVARQIHSSREFAAKGVARVVPPWPAERMLMAGPAAALRADPRLQIDRELARSGDFLLVWASPR
jgi:4-amino-4-deoxy-L-arabinose transferase-like glycosyltransferase